MTLNGEYGKVMVFSYNTGIQAMTNSVNLVPFWAFARKEGEPVLIYKSHEAAVKYRKTCLAKIANEWAKWCAGESVDLAIDSDGTPCYWHYPTPIKTYPIGTANAQDWAHNLVIDWGQIDETPAQIEAKLNTQISTELELAHAKITQLEAELAELKGKNPSSTLLDLLTGPVMPGEDLYAERADDGYLYEDCRAWWSCEYSIDAPPPEFVIHGNSLVKLRKFGNNKDCALAVIDALNGSVGRMVNLFDQYQDRQL